MGKDTVFANGKSVATMGTDHVAVNAEGFDELLVPPKMDPMPTLNIGYMSNLKNGSTRTFHAGQPIWHVGGYITPTEEYAAQPAGSLGAVTGAPYRGTAVCVQGSPNVFVEGCAVVRHFDPTKQDSGNSSGQVLMKSDLDRLKKALDDELRRRRAAGAAKKKKGRGAARQAPKTQQQAVQPSPADEAKAQRLADRKALIAAGKAKAGTYPPGSVERSVLENAANRLDRNNTTVEMARLSGHVYDLSKPPPTGWRVVRPFSDPISGFQAALYENTTDGRTVLAFRGTEGLLAPGDWNANIRQGAGLPTAQYTEAWLAAQWAARNYPGVTMTGHSLGGGLASLASIGTGRPGTTFNAAGLNRATAFYHGADWGSADRLIQANRMQGDPLTGLQEGKWTGWAVPNALGTKYDYSPTTNPKAGMIDLHSMDLMEKEIEAQKEADKTTLRAWGGLEGP
ncbi:MAG: DUF4150 domain-containing protein [Polyangiaceae bacterium]|nr:DUF4150 domain-containing protein [Polyangiaceae bacterium]